MYAEIYPFSNTKPMISTDFAPNESWDDALISIQMLFQPWNYQQGPVLMELRRELGKLVNSADKTAITFYLTGRSALYYYLKALALPPGSEVLIQGFTCAAVSLPVIEAGLKPVYVDIESETYSMQIGDLRKKCSPNAKVLILQHTFGFTPRNQSQILSFAKEHELTVLVDLAHGFQSDTVQNASRELPKISFLVSFGRSKPFSSVFGGAIMTTDPDISTKLALTEKKLSPPPMRFLIRCLLYKPLAVFIKATYDSGLGKAIHKILNSAHLLIPEISTKEKNGSYDAQYAGAYPHALAVLLMHQLKKYAKTSQKRLTNAKRYEQSYAHNHRSNYPVTRYPIIRQDRDAIRNTAAGKNIYLGTWYDQVVAPKQIRLDTVQYTLGSCPTAESICAKILNLPLDTYITL